MGYAFDDVRITSNHENCWNVSILYGSYVIKWSFFSSVIFLDPQLFDNVDIFDNVKIMLIVVCLH